MKRRYEINPAYAHLEAEILSVPERFEQEGETIYVARNTLKVLETGGIRMCVKSFKRPHILNKLVYAFFRKPKAERSYTYARRFQEMGIGTPEPVAFIAYRKGAGLTDSYYICLHLEEAITVRGIKELPAEEQDEAYEGIASFTYDFHRKGVYFTDHSAGNTLITRDKEGGFRYALVDLNRTRFGDSPVSYKKGLKNLSMLELPPERLQVIARKYASLWGKDPEQASQRLICLTARHNRHVRRKSWLRNTRRAIKRRLFPQNGR